MRCLLLFFTVLYAVNCTFPQCPPNFELVKDGQCRGFYTTVTLPDDQAENIAEQNYWKSQASGTSELVLGLTCEAGTWQWADGTPVDYKPPSYAPVEFATRYRRLFISHTGRVDERVCDMKRRLANSRKKNIEDWTTHAVQAASGSLERTEWCDADPDTFQIYCTFQLPALTTPAPDGCDGFEDDIDDGVCYQVASHARNWQDAQIICQKLGANLASVHSDQENNFIRRQATEQKLVKGIFIGGTDTGRGSLNFGWIDGSEWDYSHFYDGFPKAGFGDCIAMDTSTITGEWMNVDCTQPLPVACARSQRSAPVCSKGTWMAGTLITSPGFPYSASTPCEYWFMVDAGKKVEVEILFLEANSCCDQLIIYDGQLGGNEITTCVYDISIRMLSGEVSNATFTTTSNIMRVAWLPQGGVNVRMIYRAV